MKAGPLARLFALLSATLVFLTVVAVVPSGAFAAGVAPLLYSVDFVSASTGWAVGWPGVILKTTNGGLTWTTQRLDSTQAWDYTAVDFVTSRTGWVVGFNEYSHDGIILKTTTGGATWTTRTFSANSEFLAVHFLNVSTGWAGGWPGVIRKTTDGGRTWITKASGTRDKLWSVDFVDSHNGWAVGGDSIYDSDSDTWRSTATILRTTNGGSTWKAQTAVNTSRRPFSVRFISPSIGWIAGGSWDLGGAGYILKTTNGGTGWTAQSTGAVQDLSDIHFISASNGWAVGRGGTILETVNGGTSWIARYSGTVQDLSSVLFRGASNGWAVGDGVILRTADGGATWAGQIASLATLYTPKAPSSMSHTRSYTIYGYLKPWHAAGTYPVHIYKYKLVSGHWKSYGYVKARASDYSTFTKYSARVKLTTRGKWRVRAYAPADGQHPATWSNGYDYVTVK